MADARLHDRRLRIQQTSLDPRSRLCRLCWRVVVIEPEFIEMADQFVYVRCPHCTGSFPIRQGDVEMFRHHETSLIPEATPGPSSAGSAPSQ